MSGSVSSANRMSSIRRKRQNVTKAIENSDKNGGFREQYQKWRRLRTHRGFLFCFLFFVFLFFHSSVNAALAIWDRSWLPGSRLSRKSLPFSTRNQGA